MNSFKIFKNNSKSKETYPYLIDVQNEIFSKLSTRLVIPVVFETELGKSGIKYLNPKIQIGSKSYFALTQQMAAVSKTNLGEEIIHTDLDREVILASIDFLITGF